jgi:hypothetical protein
MILAALLLTVFSAPAPVAAEAPDYTVIEILNSIRLVETRGTPNSGRDSGGDSGRAIGPFQIHVGYWQDAGLPGKYEDCRDIDYARRVVIAYWRRYCPQALAERDAEVLARTHNGGPTGAKRDSTQRFWKKVRTELENARKPSESDAKKDEPARKARTEIALVPPARSAVPAG